MINDEDLHKWEQLACSSDSYEHQIIATLVSEVRRLCHEANDPNYLYAGGRIHRQAVIVRDAEIQKLTELLKESQKCN